MAYDSTTSSANCNPDATSASPRDPLWEWTARIHISKDELGDVYGGSGATICIFLGVPPEDPNEWLLAPNLAGSHHVLGHSGGARGGGGHGYGARHSAGHGGGAARGGSVNEGFVHLNAAISRHSGLHSFDPEVVVPYLRRELEWRAQKMDTTPIEPDSLEVVVFATPLTFPPGGMFPVPGERRQYNTITYGKKGGSRDAEDKL